MSWRREKAGESLLQSLLLQAAQPCRDPSLCTHLHKERCFAVLGTPCSGKQAAVGSTACPEIWSGLYFHQDTSIFCGILHLAQKMGQANHLGDMRNSVIAVCLPPPTHSERVAGGKAAARSPLESSSWASVLPRTVPSLALKAPSPDGACKRKSKLAWPFPLPAADGACASMGKGSQAIPSGKEGQEHLLSFSVGHPAVPALLPALLERLEPSPAVASHPPHLSLSISSARRP